MSKSSEERIGNVEVSITFMENSIKELKSDMTSGFNSIREEIKDFRKEIMDGTKGFMTHAEFNEKEKGWLEKLDEIRKIATSRLWQAVGLTLLLSSGMTALLYYFIANVQK